MIITDDETFAIRLDQAKGRFHRLLKVLKEDESVGYDHAMVASLFMAVESLNEISTHPLIRAHKGFSGPHDILRSTRNHIAHNASGSHPSMPLMIDAAAYITDVLHVVHETLKSAPRTSSKVNTTRVIHAAEVLVDILALFLPMQQRSRYAEELRAELFDLAQVKATGSMQIFYVFRQLARTWQLRRALQDPHGHGFEFLYGAARWILISQVRTWGMISLITTMALFDVVVQQGPGSAFFAVPTVWMFHTGVEWLRKHWGVTVKGKKQPEDE